MSWITNNSLSDKKPNIGQIVWVTDGAKVSNGVYYPAAKRFYVASVKMESVTAWSEDELPPHLSDVVQISELPPAKAEFKKIFSYLALARQIVREK